MQNFGVFLLQPNTVYQQTKNYFGNFVLGTWNFCFKTLFNFLLSFSSFYFYKVTVRSLSEITFYISTKKFSLQSAYGPNKKRLYSLNICFDDDFVCNSYMLCTWLSHQHNCLSTAHQYGSSDYHTNTSLISCASTVISKTVSP